jgi:hypothetical protein
MTLLLQYDQGAGLGTEELSVIRFESHAEPMYDIRVPAGYFNVIPLAKKFSERW